MQYNVNKSFITALWEFSRPHTIVGTVISIMSLFFISLETFENIFSFNAIFLLLVLMIAISSNIYITGLNQIIDIDIDRINKPYLPLVTGSLSVKSAKIITMILGTFSLISAYFLNIYVFLAVFLSILIGTMYSINPIRLKNYPLLASLSILSVRGLIVNIGFFLAFKDLVKGSLSLNENIIFLTVFITIFSFSIALIKDIVDTEGDKMFFVKTFPISFGKKPIFLLSISILYFLYIGSIMIGLFSNSSNLNISISIVNLIILAFLTNRVLNIDIDDNKSVSNFYFFIWKLFYIAYISFTIFVLIYQ